MGKAEINTHRISGYAQGTTYQITYYAPVSIISQRQTDSILLKIDSSLSLYKPYSLINRFNSCEKELQIDKHFQAVVKRSLEIYKETDGVFDITVKPVVQAWGFGVKRSSAIPDSNTINELMTCVGSDKLNLKRTKLSKSKPCVQIDVNGIAQGYTVDVLADFLEEKGIVNYMIELGGEIRVKGRKPNGSLMSIGIEAVPSNAKSEEAIQKVLHIPEGAVTTSGTYRQYFTSGNRQISHLIDARTGYPIENELISVTVWAPNAITADGYDNALMGMGLDNAMKFIEKRKNLEAHFIYQKGGSVADTASTGFYKFIQ